MFGILVAAQLAIVAHAADTVGACEPLDVSVAVSAPGTVLPTLRPPSFAPFDVLRSSVVPHVARDSRAVPSTMVEYRYVLVADAPGRYVIPEFEARLGGETVRSRPLTVLVTPSTGGEPAIVTRARIDTGNEVGLRVAAPETVYVGQQADYTVAVFLNAAMRERLRHNPTFYPPDMQSVLAYDFAAGSTEERSLSGSRCFDALVYRRALFPLQPGRVVIPPAQLTYSLPVGASFFSREESHEMQTDSAVIIAVDPPAAGQPPDFDGAVGDWRLSARLQSAPVRVGDPLTLTVRVSGTGNVKLLPRPRLAVPWATVVAADVRVRVDSSGRYISGSKEFDWVLTPRVAGEMDLPAVRYSYFDPQARGYRVASSAPVRLRVQPGTLAALDTARAPSALAIRTRYRGALARPLSSQPVFWLLLAVAPLPALGAGWRRRRRRAPRAVEAPEERLARAARDPRTGRDAPGLRRAFVAALAERLQLDAETFTTPGALRHALRRAGASTEAADEAERLLRELDAAAFGPGGTTPADAGGRALAVVRRVNDEALPRFELPFRAGALVALVALGLGGTLHALQTDATGREFQAGVAAYERHAYDASREAFARVAVAEPRAADAWANFGTAAWAARDTVDAVVGWRRALGLEPLADDARDRLALVHGLSAFSPGYVPPAPLDLLLVVMAVCWIAACAAWHPALRRRAPWARRLIVPGVAGAALLGLAAIAVDGPLTARSLAVVRRDAMLASDPAFGSGTGPSVETGEIVRVLGQQGAWMRVELDGGRQGWMPDQQLVALDAPLPSPLD